MESTSERRLLAPTMFDEDTLEGRALRAEGAAKAAMEHAWQLDNELRAVDQALADERVPLAIEGYHPTRMGRIRALGDRARRAEHEIKRLRETFNLPNRYGLPPGQRPLDGQLDVYDCIAEVERVR